MHPTTDIVCLVHNQLPVTKGFVKHLFANTKNFRLIFVDNGSDDETREYLESGDDWTLVRSDENLGVIGGRNLGVQSVEADYFMNIDNDQYPGPGWLQGLHDLMDSGFDIVGPEAWRLSPPRQGGKVMMNGRMHDRAYFPYHHCSRQGETFTYIGCGGMLIKKEIYDKIGLFDDQFSPAYFEDPDFCFRAIRAGYKLGWKYRCPINHLAHQTISRQSLFQKNDQFVASWRKFQKKWTPYFPEEMRTL